MKLISLNKITDNMVLAKNVYAKEGNVLLAKDTPLKQNYAKKLLEWGVNSVYVQDNQGELLEIDDELCRQANDTVLLFMGEFFGDLNSEQLSAADKKTLETVMKQLMADENILRNLVEIRAVSEDIFRHCVNVSILSMIIGSFSGYSVNRLAELAMGAILIDLGKTVISHQLLDDPNLLSPQEKLELQDHTRLGYEKLKQVKGNYENAAQVVLQHHENYDGTGFPQGLKGQQINEYARIAAIADIFHLQQARDKERGFNLNQTIEDGSGTLFDPEFAKLFSQRVAPLINNGAESTTDLTPQTKQSPATLEDNVSNPQKISNTNNTELKPTRPSDAEYRHESSKTDVNNASLMTKMFGRFANRAQQTDETAKLQQATPSQEAFGDRQRNDPKIKGLGRPSLEDNHGPASDTHSIADKVVENDKFVVYPEWCQHTKIEALKIVAKSLSRLGTDLVPKKVIETTRLTIEELLSNNDVISNLVTIHSLDDNIFSHCVAVGLLSVMTGASLGYTPEQLKELGTGSLLVDLGKVEISRKYNVDSRWIGTVEYAALMPEHTQLGFEQLWKIKRNTNTPYIALQHHERYDGSGFPTGLKGQQINELARVVALADAYDTLINEGMNGQKLMLHEVIEYIRDYSGTHFDPELSRVFLQNVTPFLIGSNVLLNTGEKAKVIKINKDLLARPIIRVILDKDGNKLPTPFAKDLATDLTLFIVGALKDDEF